MQTRRLLLFTGLVITAIHFNSGCSEKPAEKADPATQETTVKAPPVAVAPFPEIRTFVFSEGSQIRFGDPENAEIPKGGFSNFVGKLEVAGAELASDGKHSITIDMASVFTNNPQTTALLKSDEFLANAFFPVARLTLNQAVGVGEGLVELSGTFEFHGEAKEVTLPATVKSSAGEVLDLSAELTVNWKDFGVPGSDELKWDKTVLQFDLIAAPGEPQALELIAQTDTPEENRFGGTTGAPQQRPGGFGNRGDGKGRADWRNMTEEERAERRRQFMAEMDKNGDGNLAKDELSERMWQFMSRADKNGDDTITEAERNEYRAERESERAMRELNGEEPRRFGDRGGDRSGGKGDGGK